MNGPPIISQINNGILSTTNSMPKKDITSDNDSSFGMNRHVFYKSYTPTNIFSNIQSGSTVIQRSGLGLNNNKSIITGNKSIVQKKWIGGNRDASQIISNRRIRAGGSTMSTTGENSFKNVKDNNTARDAIIKMRSRGSVVPPKVSQKNISPVLYSVPAIPYYRIVSSGLRPIEINNGQQSGAIGQAGSVYNVFPNVYKYTNIAPNKIAISSFGRSYNVVTISRTTGITNSYNYDVFGSSANIANLTNFLNGLDNSVIVIIFTYDEPQTTNNGSTIITSSNYPNLVNAFIRCGASNLYPSSLMYRSAYVLVGIPGAGPGLERFAGLINNDPTSWIDLLIRVVDGMYEYVSG